jgi:phenylalanyl-tRNA synthetase alpha chain
LSIDTLDEELRALEKAFHAELAPLRTEQELRAAAARFLGKKGRLQEVMRQMGALPPAERPKLGEAVNRTKGAIEGQVEERLRFLAQVARQKDLDRVVDVTLPGRPVPRGRLHLLNQVRREMVEIFAELGFAVAEGPQVETEFNNFEALAMPAEHPARDMQDTFYVEGGIVLRTHTSPVQVRTMLGQKPPIKIIAPGVVYRKDDDATHSPMFSQIEGLCVDEGVRMSDLKGVLLHFVSRFFDVGGEGLALRFAPTYFPFVEPGVDIAMQCAFCRVGKPDCRVCKGTGFLEIGGAGMVNPRVFQACGIDSERYTGFAFGMGIERMAMLRHDVYDIKLYYEGDLRFLEQF